MISKFTPLITLSALVSAGFSYSADPLSALEIMQKSEDSHRVRELEATSVLETVRADGAKKEKVFEFWRKVKPNGVHFNTLTRFHSPAEVKDEAILFLENAEGANDILLYLPAYKKIRRVERTQQSSSFMGSDLSYSDLTTQHASDYNYKLQKEEACPSDEAKSVQCYVIETSPKTDSIRERTGYSSGTTWVRKDNFMGVRAIYKDETGAAFKEIDSSRIQLVDAQEKKWFAHEIRVKNLKNGTSTFLNFKKLKANGGISDALFTQQKLGPQ